MFNTVLHIVFYYNFKKLIIPNSLSSKTERIYLVMTGGSMQYNLPISVPFLSLLPEASPGTA